MSLTDKTKTFVDQSDSRSDSKGNHLEDGCKVDTSQGIGTVISIQNGVAYVDVPNVDSFNLNCKEITKVL